MRRKRPVPRLVLMTAFIATLVATFAVLLVAHKLIKATLMQVP
jgi:hypothetical protein